MEFLTRIVVTAIALLLISRLLRGFEVNNWFTALVAALILGLINALMAPFAERIGQYVGELIASTALAYPIKLVMLFVSMLAINAVVLMLAAMIGPGFRISNFKTAMVGALLLVVFNWLFVEAVRLAFAN